jgi:hypothetical protein
MQLRRIRRATHTLMPGVSAMTIQETANNPNAPSAVDDAGDGAGLRQSLGTLRLIFLIIAAAAPMAAVLGVVPVAFAFGNGAGLPLTFLAVALVLGLFSIGYSAMSKEIVSAGAFYAYIARGLGVVAGLGGAFLAIVSYVTFICGAVGYFAFFSKIALHDIFGIDVHWTVTGIFAILFCAVLGYRQIDFSSRMLALLLMAEFVVLIILSGAIVWGKGAAAFPASVFSLNAVLSGAPGVAVMLAFTCFIGVESAALYSEEAKAPSKSVGTATIGAILITVCFYFLTTWITVGAVDGDIQTVASAQVANLYFGLSDQYIGGFATKAMMLFLATSMLATNLAVHNVSSRYIFSLGRQSSLPAMLGRTHPRGGDADLHRRRQRPAPRLRRRRYRPGHGRHYCATGPHQSCGDRLFLASGLLALVDDSAFAAPEFSRIGMCRRARSEQIRSPDRTSECRRAQPAARLARGLPDRMRLCDLPPQPASPCL